MRIEIDKKGLEEAVYQATDKIAKDVQKTHGLKFTKEYLDVACPWIQAYLKMASSLPTKGGLRQFYDTQSDQEKRKAGWKIPKNTTDPHLIEMWEVSYELGEDGEGTIIIKNQKLVKGRTSYYSLFQLLFFGTDTYVSPIAGNKLTYEQGIRMRSAEVQGSTIHKRWLEARDKEASVISEYTYRVGKRKTPKGHLVRDRNGAFIPTKKKSVVDVFKEEAAKRELGGGIMGGSGSNQGDRAPETKAMGGVGQKGWRPPWVRKILGQGLTVGAGARYGKREMHFARDVYPTGKGYMSDFTKQSQPKKMMWYNRFKGKFYYNQIWRKGIDDVVVTDFHNYLTDCIYRGLVYAGEALDIKCKTPVQLFREGLKGVT
jgi:hypothetical protein